jgi:hypothetical protein
MCAESDLAMLDHRVRFGGSRQASEPTNHLDLTSIEVLETALPLITLLAARDRRDAAKKLLANKIDPSEQKKADQREAIKVKPTFRFVSERWFRIKVIGEKKAGPTRVREERNLKVLNAVIGDMDATEIEPPDVLRAITPAQDAEHQRPPIGCDYRCRLLKRTPK